MNEPKPIPEGSIIITPTEVYNEVKSLTDAVRDLIANDARDADVRAALTKQVEHLEVRVTAVERKMLFFTGVAAACGAGVGTWLPKFLGS